MSSLCSGDITRFMKSRAIMGQYYPIQNCAVAQSPKLGNVLVVDAVNGNDSTGVVGGLPFKTVNAAVNSATPNTNQVIWVLPGIYNLTSPIVMPDGVSMRGLNVQSSIIQMTNVIADTTLLTMGSNSRIEDLTLNLTSTGHYTLIGIAFTGTTTATTKLRTCVLTVNNSTAPYTGTSEVTGIKASGTGALSPGSFAFNSLKGSTVNVYSNGGGNKRGVLVSSSNTITTRDLNVYVAAPADSRSAGSYVGIETNDPASTGSIQLRATTVGTFTSSISGTSSDILQTTPSSFVSPTYLLYPGIQIGPGTDLVTKNAGGKGFSSYVFSSTIFYGMKGTVGGPAGWLWPGTQTWNAGVFPDTGLPAAYYRVQQPFILGGMCMGLNLSCGNSNSVTALVQKTPVATGVRVDTSYSVTISGAAIVGTFYNGSVNFSVGDYIHVYFSYTTNNPNPSTNNAHDVTVQLDLF
uniref:DUF1565 domain-containing protein n=1 Tax=viral metagenome TaxID=1070528 RepID=A0A6C0CK03_9ZZZZ